MDAATCDQTRRSPEQITASSRPRVALHIPSAIHAPAAADFLASEYRRLAAFFARHDGSVLPHPESLREARRRLAEQRAILSAHVSSTTAAGAARQFAHFPNFNATTEPACSAGGPGIVVLGGPLARHDLRMLDRLEQFGLQIVSHGYDRGPRTWPAPPHEKSRGEDPWLELARAMLARPDVFQRPAHDLHQWLEKTCRQTRAAGILCISHRWCDLWRGEFARIRDANSIYMRSRLAVLEMESADTGDGFDASRSTRLEAFAENILARPRCLA